MQFVVLSRVGDPKWQASFQLVAILATGRQRLRFGVGAGASLFGQVEHTMRRLEGRSLGLEVSPQDIYRSRVRYCFLES
jgi:hypothetical protein